MTAIAIVLSVLILIWSLLPQRDGGGIPYSVLLVAPQIPLLGIAVVWAVWAMVWAVFG